MVRFIMLAAGELTAIRDYLHSTMVRFIIIVEKGKAISTKAFTFHYG